MMGLGDIVNTTQPHYQPQVARVRYHGKKEEGGGTIFSISQSFCFTAVLLRGVLAPENS